MLGLGLRRLKRAGQNGQFHVFQNFGHLRVRHVFVDQDTFDQHGVFQLAAGLGRDLDQFEVDVFGFEVGDA